MIRSLVIITHPRIYMDMFHPRRFLFPLYHPLAHIHMVEFLTVLFVDIRVAFRGWDVDNVIQIEETGFRSKDG